MIPVTKHAKKRIKNRLGNKKQEEVYGEALLYGKPRTEFKGDFRRYLDKQSIIHNSDCIVYKNMAFWHKNNVLITVYQIPSYFIRRIKNL